MDSSMKYVSIIFLLFSCSPNFHCRKCNQAQPTKSDTTYKIMTVEVPTSSVDSVFVSIPGDTVIVTNDRVQLKYVRLPGKKDSVWIYGNCLPDTVEIKVPTLVTNEIKTGWPTGYIVLSIIGALLVGGLVVKLFT